jgi:hypothetical protein
MDADMVHEVIIPADDGPGETLGQAALMPLPLRQWGEDGTFYSWRPALEALADVLEPGRQ